MAFRLGSWRLLTLIATIFKVALSHDGLEVNDEIGVPGYPDCIQEDWSAKDKHLTLKCYQNDSNDGRIRIGCVGDSITAGVCSSAKDFTYPSQLQKMLGDNYAVTNLGACGSTMLKKGDSPYWERPQFLTLTKNVWDVLVIMLGTNDAKDAGSGGPSNWSHNCIVSSDSAVRGDSNNKAPNLDCDFAADYSAMIELVTKNGGDGPPTIFVVVPPPLMQQGAYGMNQTVINDVYPALMPLIAKKNNITKKLFVIDVFASLGGGEKGMIPTDGCSVTSPIEGAVHLGSGMDDSRNKCCKYFCDKQSCDQCHPNDVGYNKIAKTVAMAIADKSTFASEKNVESEENILMS